jgi:hypothetical protein
VHDRNEGAAWCLWTAKQARHARSAPVLSVHNLPVSDITAGMISVSP